MYSNVDVEEIIRPIGGTEVKIGPPSICVVSGSTATSLPDHGVANFLEQVVGDMLIRPLSIGQVIALVVSEVNVRNKEQCQISSVGPSNASPSFLSALKAGSGVEISIGEQLGLTKSVSGPLGVSTKVAVVGMSGCFPNADNLDSLWTLLEQGLDVHRRVPPDRFDIDEHYIRRARGKLPGILRMAASLTNQACLTLVSSICRPENPSKEIPWEDWP